MKKADDGVSRHRLHCWASFANCEHALQVKRLPIGVKIKEHLRAPLPCWGSKPQGNFWPTGVDGGYLGATQFNINLN